MEHGLVGPYAVTSLNGWVRLALVCGTLIGCQPVAIRVYSKAKNAYELRSTTSCSNLILDVRLWQFLVANRAGGGGGGG